ncbi:YceI family protein [Bdellovibrionota bacterium FG-1]
MHTYGPSEAEVLIYTFKEGLLSGVAHDLKLRVTRFKIEEDDAGVIRAEFDPSSLQVVCAMKDGKDKPSALPAIGNAEIETNIQKSVLFASKYPTIRFESSQLTNTQIEGQLSLCGATHKLIGTLKTDGSRMIAFFQLDQRDFGIKPFNAMLGSLKVKPIIEIQISAQQRKLC